MPKPGDKSVYGFNSFDSAALVKLIGNGDATYPENRPRGGGGGSTPVLFATPSGGILGAQGSPPTFVTPSSLCTRYEWSTLAGRLEAVATTETALVYNISDQDIAGNVLIKAVMVDGRYVVDVAGCGSGGQSFQDWRV